jgi:hypothetical protein
MRNFSKFISLMIVGRNLFTKSNIMRNSTQKLLLVKPFFDILENFEVLPQFNRLYSLNGKKY